MPLILAIEPDKRQSSQLAAVVKGLHVELVHRANATDALSALQGRVPDLVLTTSLISPKDDAALAAHLRELGPAAAHVQTVTIPLLGTAAAPPRPKTGMLAALRREKPQAPVTDGCSPDVFADQVRQYLATAEEQKSNASMRVAAVAVETVAIEPATGQSIVTDDFLAAEPELAEPEFFASATEAVPAFEEVPEPFVELAVPEPEPVVEAVAEPVAEAVLEPEESEEFAVDEPAGPPLSQLLQFVSDTAPAAAAPVAGESIFVEESIVVDEPIAEAPAEPVVEMATEPEVAQEPIAEPVPARVPAIAAEWRSEEGWDHEPESALQPELEPQPAPKAASDFGDLYVGPMAAAALDELSQQITTPSVADGIPGEPPVPIVEMRGFQSLDSIASELAAGPSQPYENLDDLASLFAARPAGAAPPVAPAHGGDSEFASLFAEPAPVRAATPIDVPGIDPGLFASAPAAPPAVVAAPEPEPVIEEEPIVSFEPVVFEPVAQEPEPEPVAAAAAPSLDEEISLDVDAFTFAPPEPAEPAEPSRFSFTFVDGFGDALSDFDVPNAAAMAAELGVGEHPPSDPYAANPRAATPAPRETAGEAAAAPALDDEALSLIGDAARKVSLDAFVVNEFERGVADGRVKKAKKKVHAGATRVPPAAERPAAKPAKRPVQDEWGMFDPEQCGFAALEDEDAAEEHPTTGTRVRVISY